MSAEYTALPRETGEVLSLIPAGDAVYEVDPETGEVLAVHPPEPEFVIDSRERADWVLGKMLVLDTEIAAIDNSAIVQQARAVIANAEKMKADLARRRAALEWRFGPELAHFARANLGKTKTWRGYYGSVSFRATPARLTVCDLDKAAWWALGACPDAARVTFDLAAIADPDTRQVIADLAGKQRDAVKAAFLVSLVPDELRDDLIRCSLDITQWGLDRAPEGPFDGDSATIKTAVGS